MCTLVKFLSFQKFYSTYNEKDTVIEEGVGKVTTKWLSYDCKDKRKESCGEKKTQEASSKC